MTPPRARSRTDFAGVGVVTAGVACVLAGVLSVVFGSVFGSVFGVGVGVGFGFGVVFIGLGVLIVFIGVLALAQVRGWDVRRSFSVHARRAAGSGTTLARSGLVTGAGWRVMCAAARLMPRAAGRRWLAEAESFLAEAPPAQRRPAIRSYLITAPQVITVSWAGDLARRARGMKRAAR